MKLLIALSLLSFVYAIGWYQIHGQFISEWFRKYELYLIWISVATTFISIKAIKLVNEYFQGEIWPNRIITFTIGIILFSFLTAYHFNEKINVKTITLVGLCAVIVCLQVFWK